ncbi:MAG: sulfotransferase [Anaerolineae bacterium]
MGIFKKIFKPTLEQVITIVSGLPRSGTSMMMKMLEAGGIPPLTDEVRRPDTDNPKGYYEFERVKGLDKGDTIWLRDAYGKSVKVISALLKHLPPDHQYRIIFMRREMPEVLASQRRMLIHRGEDADKMDDEMLAQLYAKHLKSTSDWINMQPNMSTLYVQYGDIVSDPLSQIERINVFLGNKLNTTKMAEIVDPDLYRNRQPASGPVSRPKGMEIK